MPRTTLDIRKQIGYRAYKGPMFLKECCTLEILFGDYVLEMLMTVRSAMEWILKRLET